MTRLSCAPELLFSSRDRKADPVGHSDGASIALIHAGAGHAVRGIAAMAPHVFIEPICLTSIAKAKADVRNDGPAGAARALSSDARKTFYGWADVWLDPQFERWDHPRRLPAEVRCPLLAIQGRDDEYGTMAQLDEIERRVAGPCELVKLPDAATAVSRSARRDASALVSFIGKSLSGNKSDVPVIS